MHADLPSQAQVTDDALPASASSGLDQRYGPAAVTHWLVTAMLAGAVMMSLELVAFRLYAPYFGYSIYVWGTMISVVMAALAVGYPLGGRLADRLREDLPL